MGPLQKSNKESFKILYNWIKQRSMVQRATSTLENFK